MNGGQGAGRSSATLDFGVFLRTGRLIAARRPIEVKFNPYHDPRNGQFTSGPGGGSGGGSAGSLAESVEKTGGKTTLRPGGGSFGGGGASGSWGPPKSPTPAVKPTVAPVPAKKPASSTRAGPAAAATSKPAADPSSWKTVSKNGYDFAVDESGRTRRVTGALKLDTAQRRSRSAQAQAGGDERLSSDEGGHYIARRFGGPTDAFNHFAQDGSFNRGQYKALENKWATALARKSKVWVKVTPLYAGNSKRPWALDVYYETGGNRFRQRFPNAKGISK